MNRLREDSNRNGCQWKCSCVLSCRNCEMLYLVNLLILMTICIAYILLRIHWPRRSRYRISNCWTQIECCQRPHWLQNGQNPLPFSAIYCRIRCIKIDICTHIILFYHVSSYRLPRYVDHRLLTQFNSKVSTAQTRNSTSKRSYSIFLLPVRKIYHRWVKSVYNMYLHYIHTLQYSQSEYTVALSSSSSSSASPDIVVYGIVFCANLKGNILTHLNLCALSWLSPDAGTNNRGREHIDNNKNMRLKARIFVYHPPNRTAARRPAFMCSQNLAHHVSALDALVHDGRVDGSKRVFRAEQHNNDDVKSTRRRRKQEWSQKKKNIANSTTTGSIVCRFLYVNYTLSMCAPKAAQGKATFDVTRACAHPLRILELGFCHIASWNTIMLPHSSENGKRFTPDGSCAILNVEIARWPGVVCVCVCRVPSQCGTCV